LQTAVRPQHAATLGRFSPPQLCRQLHYTAPPLVRHTGLATCGRPTLGTERGAACRQFHNTHKLVVGTLSPVQSSPPTPSQPLLTCRAPTQLDLLPLSPPGLPKFARSDTTPQNPASSLKGLRVVLKRQSPRSEVGGLKCTQDQQGLARAARPRSWHQSANQVNSMRSHKCSCSCSLVFSGLAACLVINFSQRFQVPMAHVTCAASQCS
jgi:hypothetical protein